MASTLQGRQNFVHCLMRMEGVVDKIPKSDIWTVLSDQMREIRFVVTPPESLF